MKKNVSTISIFDIPIEDIRKGAEPLIRRHLRGYFTNLMFKVCNITNEEVEFIVLCYLIDENNHEEYSSWKFTFKVKLDNWSDSEISKLSAFVSSIFKLHDMHDITCESNEKTLNVYLKTPSFRYSKHSI